MISRSAIYGFMGTAALLTVYFLLVSLISGWSFALSQFSQFWYFIISLAIGFGIQIGLYTYLKKAVNQIKASGGVLAVSGTTSTAAMISCCAHYLANIIPVVGVAGAITVVAQYQTEIFWIGLVFNALGIIYVASKIVRFKKHFNKTQP